MAANTFYLKANDTNPTLRVRLKNPDRTPHDLTGAFGVTLHIRPQGTTDVISRAMSIYNPTEGIVHYQWLPGDWNDLVVGLHLMEYEVTAAAGARATFPNGGKQDGSRDYDRLSIVSDLGQWGYISMPALASGGVLYAPSVA